MSTTKIEGTARERLLAAANELFYAEGVHTVGIDRVIERAGVAKASLYSTFGSKDELVRAYLAARHELRRKRLAERIARHDNPRDRILAIFDLQGELFREPTFRGCAFVNASAEGPRGGQIQGVCDDSRAFVRGLFTDLARELGVADPENLGRRLVLLYDGATVAASMDRNPRAAAEARAMAAALLDEARSAAAPRARAGKRRAATRD